MSFASVDVGFSERRYSFEGPNFGFADNEVVSEPAMTIDCDRCPVCGLPNAESRGVWCAGQEFIAMQRQMVLQALSNTIDEPYDGTPDPNNAEEESEDDDVEDDDDEDDEADDANVEQA